ncbi:uncharacterized protein TNCV_5099571 [Trichonephila clavipes]|uniref:Uncharacterized protein n=1 Tax=Trichonephila clavipes TaxID=2585209 RepID=A0A8X6RWT3_TRICX|nr:uncharacterized protein TNCV_5099571 [Trichonephila clavipes]
MKEMHHLARERIGMASDKMKTRYDARATGHDFHEGNKVWLWNPKHRKGISPKLQTNWGLKRLNDVVVRIQKSPHSKPKVDFDKRNIPSKRARSYFSQLSEFQRGLIFGMKTAGSSMHRVAGQLDRLECAVRNCKEQWTREGTHARKIGSGVTKKTTRREDRRIVRQALVDPTVTRSTI